MRTKDEILDVCREDTKRESNVDTLRTWVEIRKIEVLIDIRDILDYRLNLIYNLFNEYIIKH